MRLSFIAFIKNQITLIAGFIALFVISAGALHFDRESIPFTTIDELFSPGKEVKVWSDTSIIITGIVFKYRTNISWDYKTCERFPCTLSVRDTFNLSIYASYVRNAETPVIDSLVVVTQNNALNYVPLHVAAFPHKLVTTKTVIGPASDSAGKSLKFSRDSAYCTYHHRISYTFLWDDGFVSQRMAGRTAVHSWSVPRQYNVRTVVDCQGNLSTDTTQPFQVTIALTRISAAAGAYKSGFFVFTGNGHFQQIDFSQIANLSQEGDARFDFTSDYSLIAPKGAINLGSLNALPTMEFKNFEGLESDTSAVYRTNKSCFDSIIASLQLVCPATMTDTGIRINDKQVSMIKTKEGNNAILVRVGAAPIDAIREYYYWGYQSDGNRMFVPGFASGIKNQLSQIKSNASTQITIGERGNKIRIALPHDKSAQEISVYRCNGSLIYCHHSTFAKSSSIEFLQLPKGLYVVSIRTAKEKIRQRLYIY